MLDIDKIMLSKIDCNLNHVLSACRQRAHCPCLLLLSLRIQTTCWWRLQSAPVMTRTWRNVSLGQVSQPWFSSVMSWPQVEELSFSYELYIFMEPLLVLMSLWIDFTGLCLAFIAISEAAVCISSLLIFSSVTSKLNIVLNIRPRLIRHKTIADNYSIKRQKDREDTNGLYLVMDDCYCLYYNNYTHLNVGVIKTPCYGCGQTYLLLRYTCYDECM